MTAIDITSAKEATMNRIALILVILLTVARAYSAEVYRWTDSSGALHITDYPPPEGHKLIDSRRIAPGEPPPPKSAGHIRASRELEEMEIKYRAEKRRGEKIQLAMQLKLLAAQGLPFNSVEADKLRQDYAENLRIQAMLRDGEEKITILNEYIQMQMEIANVGAICEYKRRR